MRLSVLDQLAAHFAAIAVGIEERRPDQTLLEFMSQAQALCEAPRASPWGGTAPKRRSAKEGEQAASTRADETKVLLAHLQTVLRTWQEVWPRLGHQREFRGAVGREAQRWSHEVLSCELRTRQP